KTICWRKKKVSIETLYKRGYQAGLKPGEIDAVTWADLNLFYEGYQMRQADEWDRTRNILASIANWAGKVSKRQLSPKELIKLEIDKEEDILPIRDEYEARELVREI